MLLILGVPSWRMPSGAVVPLPASLPVCLLIYLACQGRWVDRDALGTFFWPDRAPGEARHNLRVNLHRMRTALLSLCTHGPGSFQPISLGLADCPKKRDRPSQNPGQRWHQTNVD